MSIGRSRSIRSALVSGAAVLALSGCSSSDTDTSASDEAALTQANEAAQTLLSELQAELLAAVESDGFAGAAQVCVTRAGPLTDGVGEATATTVGRSSLRLRNPENSGPAWVTEWLEEQGERPVAGVEGLDVIAEEGGSRLARSLMPIGVGAPCVNCHGEADSLAEGVPELLAENYPDDEAIGYAEGDLRGAVWAEVVIAP